jgi:long-chain acyl-CoA synthetase
MNFCAELRALARQNSDKLALLGAHGVMSRAELDGAAMNFARWLRAEGVVPGERVAVHGTNTADIVVTLLGCFYAGIVAVPLNTRFKPAEIQYVLNHSRPRLCFSQPALADSVLSVQSEIPGLAEVRTGPPPGLPGSDLGGPDADAPAAILYTSGTTANPKGVTHTHRTLAASAATMRASGLDESAVAVVAMPVMHAAGLCGSLLSALAAGATVVLPSGPDAAALLDSIERWNGTWTLGLPAIMRLVAAEQERQPRPLASMRHWLAGGDSVPVDLLRRWERLFGRPLIEGYAMTESCAIAYNPISDVRPGSIGRPADGVDVRVINLDGTPAADSSPAADGHVGELAVLSPANFIGYWNDPAATASALVNGWLITGDLGLRDAEGYIWFRGRRKELIIRGGSNVSPLEVEKALRQFPAVIEAGVVGVPDEAFGERVVAFVAIRAGHAGDEAELRRFCRDLLADYKIPERVGFLPALPKGPTGKPLRRALREMAIEAGF